MSSNLEVEEIYSVSNSSCTSSCTDLLKLLISKVNAMQDQLIRMETQICNIQEHGPNIPKGVIDTEKLKKFGLPVKDVNRLDELERELIEDLKKK